MVRATRQTHARPRRPTPIIPTGIRQIDLATTTPAPSVRSNGIRGTLLTTVANMREPDKEYKIYRQPDGTLFCSCPHFLFRCRKQGTWCKHLEYLHTTYGLRNHTPNEIAVPHAEVALRRYLLLDL